MPHHNDQLKTLYDLQQKLQTAASWDAVQSVLTPFVKQYLAVDSLLIVPASSRAEQVDVWPIGNTGFSLQFSPSPAEPELTSLVTALLVSCPFIQGQPAFSAAQQSLLAQISQAIIEQQQFDLIVGHINAAFAEAFPGCRARLVLYESSSGQKLLHSVFGQQAEWLPVDGDDNLTHTKEPTLLPDDGQLILPVRSAGVRRRPFCR